MATMTADPGVMSAPGIMGPRLPLFASKAALEFDRAIQGKPMGFDSTKVLADWLKTVLGKPAGADAEATSFDAVTVGIVGRAVCPVSSRGTSIADVVNKAWAIAEQMERTTPDSDAPSLEQCRTFCVELGNSLISYGEYLNQFRPANPHKR